jgi:hypothetical protein
VMRSLHPVVLDFTLAATADAVVECPTVGI